MPLSKMDVKLKEGMIAPDFTLADQDGKKHRLKDYRGSRIILYFYPKDMTPGCTTEACNFRDDFSQFKKRDIVILGISNDDVATHRKFADRDHLPFPLLADIDREVSTAYGAYGEKSFMGRKYMGLSRMTFVIDESGTILKIYEKVKADAHSKELLKELDK